MQIQDGTFKLLHIRILARPPSNSVLPYSPANYNCEVICLLSETCPAFGSPDLSASRTLRMSPLSSQVEIHRHAADRRWPLFELPIVILDGPFLCLLK